MLNPLHAPTAIVTGANGPYTTGDGDGWYGRNAARNQHGRSLDVIQQYLTTKSLPAGGDATPEDDVTWRFRYSAEPDKTEQLTADARGAAREDLETLGDTMLKRADSHWQQIRTLAERILNEHTLADTDAVNLRYGMAPALAARLIAEDGALFSVADVNRDQVLQEDELAAAMLFMDDPKTAMSAVTDKTFARKHPALARQLRKTDSQLDGEISEAEKQLGMTLIDKAPQTAQEAVAAVKTAFLDALTTGNNAPAPESGEDPDDPSPTEAQADGTPNRDS
ncbi:MAG: hypothetical protein AB7P76_10810 [Candidatus Melainabacteria bacterium]